MSFYHSFLRVYVSANITYEPSPFPCLGNFIFNFDVFVGYFVIVCKCKKKSKVHFIQNE